MPEFTVSVPPLLPGNGYDALDWVPCWTWPESDCPDAFCDGIGCAGSVGGGGGIVPCGGEGGCAGGGGGIGGGGGGGGGICCCMVCCGAGCAVAMDATPYMASAIAPASDRRIERRLLMKPPFAMRQGAP